MTPEESRELYTECYRDKNYRMGAPRFDRMMEEINRVGRYYSFGSVIDVGCGRGELILALKDRYPMVGGCDIVPGLCNDMVHLIEDIANLPYGDKSFDLVICSDVLEHINPEDSIVAMRELHRISRMCVICHVAWYMSQWRTPDGRHPELHINRRPLRRDSAAADADMRPTWVDIAHKVCEPHENIRTQDFGRDGILTIER